MQTFIRKNKTFFIIKMMCKKNSNAQMFCKKIWTKKHKKFKYGIK